ncbi:cobalt-precorrin-6A reductase [Rhodococcus cercidiphylli]|jgi:precorrin-6A/cobalt-precorrin-6A reductase|uniref:cobalt-precorrin-6A reductase n=1 Tax=Rhodococcus TaxID=1827 RepID=UPI0011EBD6F1|nr:cobalt-precorrin-6A reductase [Rhodococcus sp. IEGM 1341]KAA0926395.1 cobalt-precorrin-6A reductase [Rhodococcus sp. ANT_H53B]MDI9924547.1 cobalt-precorrin-6A reductase [Rhodococcus sp. IEGM 1341]
MECDQTVKVLILGGTTESRALAAALDTVQGIETVTSLAGRVAEPKLPVGETRIGGFGGPDALAVWLRDNAIDVVVDATHPFASTIAAHAEQATRATSVALLVLTRPPWTAGEGDRWTSVASLPDAASAITPGSRVFLTTGRQGVHHFSSVDHSWFLVRAIDPPTGAVPPHMTLQLSRGPFDVDHESMMLAENRIDLLITKNSGGDMTRAKLDAARAASIPVLMVDRPTRTGSTPTVFDVAAAVDRLTDR